jgi:ankyrin repeat protein
MEEAYDLEQVEGGAREEEEERDGGSLAAKGQMEEGLPMEYACAAGDLERVLVLLSENEHRDHYDEGLLSTHGWSCRVGLCLAAEGEHIEMVNSLLDAGAVPPGCAPGEYLDPEDDLLEWAALRGHHEIVSRLLQHVYESGPCTDYALEGAIVGGHTLCVAALLDAYPELLPGEGVDALGIASANGQLLIVQLLISAGTEVNWQSEKTGRIALGVASEHGKLECMGALLDAGADIFAADSSGRCALGYAQGNLVAVQLLMAYGRKIGAPYWRLHSALLVAWLRTTYG